jgi:hypothetical protein
MYVIGDAANARWLDTVLFRDSAKIRPKTFSDLGAEHWNSLFSTEDAVDIQGIKCVRHRVIALINPYIMQLYFYMFYYCRDSSFSSIVPAGTAHLSLTFPGTSYRATLTSSRPGRPTFTYFSRHFVPGYCHIVPAGTVPHFNEKSFNLASNRWRSVSRISAALLVSAAIATHRSINPSRSLISTYSASIRESGVQLW